MSGPGYTEHSRGHVSQGVICASDLVFQTAGIVINENDEVLMIEDSVSGIISFPRSYTPQCLDNLLKMPVGFLAEMDLVVEPLPLRALEKRCPEPQELRLGSAPTLAYSERQTTATPFAVALDVAYLPFCNMARIADVRQSIVWWYAGMTRTRLSDIHEEKRELVHFRSMYEAEFLLLNQPPFDCVSLYALRLFRKVWEATKALPPQIKQLKPAIRWSTAWAGHGDDIPCYPAGVIEYAIPPVWTSNTSQIRGNAFWAPPDILVQTGGVLFDTVEKRVLLVSFSTPPNHNVPNADRPAFTLPRGTSDDIGALLQNPLACARIECARLDLPRMGKRYRWEEGLEDPVAVTDVLKETTTNPFMVSLHSHWDHWGPTLKQSKGRQALTYWYGGTFDSTTLPNSRDYHAVPLDDVRPMLKKDVYALTALEMFLALYKVREADLQAARLAVSNSDSGSPSHSP